MPIARRSIEMLFQACQSPERCDEVYFGCREEITDWLLRRNATIRVHRLQNLLMRAGLASLRASQRKCNHQLERVQCPASVSSTILRLRPTLSSSSDF